MAYDLTANFNDVTPFIQQRKPVAQVARTDEFHRAERLVVLVGASALGAGAGFGVAMGIGQLPMWLVISIAAPILLLALHLTSLTLQGALGTRSYGCAAAAGLHSAALLAWPVGAVVAPLGLNLFFIAPLVAMSSLVLLASCWGGSNRAVYRTGLQGALVAGLAAHHGMLMLLGS